MPDELKENSKSCSGERGERFMKLYTAVQRRLCGYVMSLIPETTPVDDIIQETVTVMWKQFDKFEPGTDFAAWACCIARNQIYNYIKQRQKQKKHFSIQTIQAIEEVVEQKSQKADQRFDALRKCITKLPDKDRQLLGLRYEAGATLRAVSRRVEQSVNTLYNRLYKIRIALLNCVEKTLAQESSGS
jgi:RNA polymerase sigma-70 factor (ECF subfamily)